MAVVMGTTYPDLYAAIGVHSGLAYQSANDVMSAFEAMRGGNRSETRASAIKTIIFHGDADATVHSSNGEQIAGMSGSATSAEQTKFAQGCRQCIRTLTLDALGEPLIEYWLMHGSGHAWAGGSRAGSFTDDKGLDASREMVRFFLESKTKA
jgi:poly(3-hydroxybutyrate) depolymerase